MSLREYTLFAALLAGVSAQADQMTDDIRIRGSNYGGPFYLSVPTRRKKFKRASRQYPKMRVK